jgi:acyl-CoA reductase-like NAD-dependent aldehyde dehydrogenase
VIVCGDAPPTTAEKLAANAFSFAGQSCISVQRIYVMDDAWDDFAAELVPQVEALKVGDPADEETDVGPVIDDDARERILSWIRDSGGELLTGGDTTDEGLIRPTVIANPSPDAKVSCEEVFGPVVTLTRTSSLEEAIELANSTRYGLQAGIFTSDLRAALEAARTLEFGGVTINEAPTFRSDQMPYGGVKASGNTREGPAYAVRELTEERLVVIQL